ncbi:tyrosine-type recombinase/integrase [Microvirga pakistanensis]|uniref:tyrosine-type recombinase/integrase n=1 Tax=Microvirga pakistanensis TaxID=1682650 RepID=UPI00106C223E|nr:integrase [Microvirga pakistanensis]
MRLHGILWTPDFMGAYEWALNGAPEPATPAEPGKWQPSVKGTWRWLCEQYFLSAEFKRLGDRTRHVRRQILEATYDESVKPGAEATFANCPPSKFSPQAVRALRDRKVDTPEAANGRVKAIRQVFVYGIEADHVKTNPARDVPYFRSASEGHHTWTAEEVLKFREKHPVGSKAWLALALLMFIGGRRADIPAFGRQHISEIRHPNGSIERWLRYPQNKNRNPVTLELPVLRALWKTIEDTPSAKENLTFLVTGFGNWFKKRYRGAELHHGSAHGLRKAGATLAAENGASEFELMAIFGWKISKQASHYTRKARQKRLAGDAMHLIDLGESENKRPPHLLAK